MAIVEREQAPSRLAALAQSLGFKIVALFVLIVVALVVPIAYTYLHTVDQLLTDTLAAEIAVAAQRGTTMIDTAVLPQITRPADADKPAYRQLLAALAAIQSEFDVDNAVVMRRTVDGGYAYIADGNGHFAINEHVALHDAFPETRPPADAAFTTGQLGKTGLFTSATTKWFQINAPLIDKGDVVGLLLINKFATPVAEEIARRQQQIVIGVVSVLAVGIALWGLLAFRLSRPLVSLRRAAAQIADGNLDVEVTQYQARDEVGDLARTFGQMVTDLKASRHQVENYTQLLQREKDAFFRFVPTQFLELLGRDSAVDIELGDSRPHSMSVMFSDIRSFTTMSEGLDAQKVFAFLNEYLERMEPAIQRNGGFVDKFLGDGIMALFQDEPNREMRSADRAVAAAIQMRHELSRYNEVRMAKGMDSVRIGVGVHTGELILGTVGSPGRLNTTVVGDTVNLASRIEALTAHYRAGIILSERAYADLTRADSHFIREIAAVRVKGKVQTVCLFDLFDWEEPSSRERKMALGEDFAAALAAYRAGDFAAAEAQFGAVFQANPEDRTALAYQERCAQYVVLPPASWDGVDTFGEK